MLSVDFFFKKTTLKVYLGVFPFSILIFLMSLVFVIRQKTGDND
jgi:hypothetical protein